MLLFPFAVLASDTNSTSVDSHTSLDLKQSIDMDVGFTDEESIQESEIYPETDPVVDSEDLETEGPLTQESSQDHHVEDIAESKTTEEDVIQEDVNQGSVVDIEPAPVEDNASEQDNETLQGDSTIQEDSATQDETSDPESILETEETTFREDDLNADGSSAGKETPAPDEKTNFDHLTDGDETVTPEEDPMKETPDSDKKTENNEVAATAEITEEESQEISLNSLSTLNVEATPQFRVELVNGYLVLRDLKSDEIRKDNKWVIDAVTQKMYFPNAQGHLYHNQFISFGPAYAYYLGSDGSKLSNQIVEVKDNLHLLNPDGLLNKSNRWASLNNKVYFPNAEGRLYRNQFITFGPSVAYYMGSDGSKLSNQIVEVNQNLHFLNPNGLLN